MNAAALRNLNAEDFNGLGLGLESLSGGWVVIMTMRNRFSIVRAPPITENNAVDTPGFNTES